MRAQKSGQVVVVSSWAGVHVSAKLGPDYTASKHAAVALAESLNAAEFGNGIRACAACPGEVACHSACDIWTPINSRGRHARLRTRQPVEEATIKWRLFFAPFGSSAAAMMTPCSRASRRCLAADRMRFGRAPAILDGRCARRHEEL